MKTKIVNLIGDPLENLYQLGITERESFVKLDARVTRLLSSHSLIRLKNDLLIRLQTRLKKRAGGLFHDCLEAYARGLGIDYSHYLSFISMFELAAHYGNIHPELKGLLPGCTSLFQFDQGDVCHSRLIDFPLIGIFDESPRLYHWKMKDRPVILNYSCEGLAPLFFQAIHESGMSFALHHKPGSSYHQGGQSIFQIAFDLLFECHTMADIKRVGKNKASVTKWGILLLDKSGQALSMDIDGPSHAIENFNLRETSPLIFTNLPIKPEAGFESYLFFCRSRQDWLKQKTAHASSIHPLDLLTDVKDQKIKAWLHPAATLSTTGAVHVNLTRGQFDVKEGSGALVRSDAIYRFDLGNQQAIELKTNSQQDQLERAWKHAASAQSAFDQGEWDRGYHELQLSIALMPHILWRDIFKFFLHLWDFRFVSNQRELSLIYKDVKKLSLPPMLKDQWLMFCMRLEKQLQLMSTIDEKDLSPHMRNLFEQEKKAPRPLFSTWMKFIYPRLELLDVFSPHQK